MSEHDTYRYDTDSFETERRLRMEQQNAFAARQAEQRKHMEDFVARFRAKASKARQAQSRLKMLARMQPIAAAIEDPSVIFRLPDPEELPPPLIVLDSLTAGYTPDKPILRHLDLRIAARAVCPLVHDALFPVREAVDRFARRTGDGRKNHDERRESPHGPSVP